MKGQCAGSRAGAIFDYIIGEYDKSHKLSFAQGSPEQYKLNYWLHFSEGTFLARRASNDFLHF